MNKSLVKHFIATCKKARVIDELPDLTDEQYEQIFYHVSNEDMTTTINTIEHAYEMIKKIHL